MLKNSNLCSEKVSFDALHCQVKTLSMMAQSGGKYLVGLKENQKELLHQVSKAAENRAILYQIGGVEKGHGRIETRRYEFYDILEIEKSDRWQNCQMRTAVKVIRAREAVKSGKKSRETSYYVSNKVGTYEEISLRHQKTLASRNRQSYSRCDAQRRSNAVKKKNISQIMAGVRTLVTDILSQTNCQNKKAQLENFSDDFDSLIITLKNLNFL